MDTSTTGGADDPQARKADETTDSNKLEVTFTWSSPIKPEPLFWRIWRKLREQLATI